MKLPLYPCAFKVIFSLLKSPRKTKKKKEFRSTLLNSFTYVFSLLILVTLESDKPNQLFHYGILNEPNKI
ncbi:hypothetical protein P5673_013737 [Acropora cervicornis]|uniref:Uncharacterized protein n=1 Tax=Acropora cervicornis TaxID=6130 RepID=A0AAD9V6A2_ACRCE|nr:hypothetical protein P5673_013737 [Acropora cervicornis]